MAVGSRGGGGRRRGVWMCGAAICCVVRVYVRQFHSSSDLWLVSVMLLQVASKRSVVAPTVWAVLSSAHL